MATPEHTPIKARIARRPAKSVVDLKREIAALKRELRARADDLRESFEHQTATSEVLRIVASSPGNLQPVFDAMLEKATELCEAKFGLLLLYDGEAYETVAVRNL